MKKILLIMVTLLFTGMVLMACSGNEEDAADENTKTETNVTKEKEDAETDPTEENQESNNEKSTNSENPNDGLFEVTLEPQLELGVGDTGTVQTSIGTYELTLDNAELVGTELDGEATLLDELMVVYLTIKNTSDDVLLAKDLMYNLGITTRLDGSNTSNNAAYFESIEAFEGELAPGEEKQTQFIADVRTSDEYYFRPNPGVVANGTHNDLLWTISDKEARMNKSK